MDTTTSTRRFDALDLELFRHAMLSIVDELEVNLTRTAYSPLIYEYKDYCIGILDSDCRLLAQSKGSVPIFVADLRNPVLDAVTVIGRAELEPGDVFITNYAPVSGQHLNNVVVATPIFDAARRLLGFICIRAHWADVGGMSIGSVSWNATDIFQEGVQYRGLRVLRRGTVAAEVMKTIEANTRLPKFVLGDLNAQIGACLLGVTRWHERVESGRSTQDIAELGRMLLSASAEFARRRISALLPDGHYAASCLLDDAGTVGSEPVRLALEIDIAAEGVDVEVRNMPPQVAAPMNAGLTASMSAVRVAFKSMLAPDIPVDEGFFEPIDFVSAEGTMVSATGAAPMAFWNNSMASIIDLVFRAIGARYPDRVPAGHHASMSVYAFFGRDDGARPWMFIDTGHGGRGASRAADGYSPLKTLGHGDTRDIPIEIMESRYPLRCHGYRFLRGSGGGGLHVGGDGTEKVIESTDDGTVAEFSLDRTIDPPWGLAGGEAGRAGDIEVMFPGSERWASFKKAGQLPLPKGTLCRVRTSGGGGWGAPEGRA